MLGTVQTCLHTSVRSLVLAGAVLLLSAAPAGADPAGPSDFRSEVTDIVPAVDGIEAEIRGGDAFLELRVEEGHEVIVEGYGGEPYLRFLADGTVERNTRSPATYANEDRKADVDIPADASTDAEPVWEEVASGTYAWHDHRSHWMAEASPPVERGRKVPGEYDPWRVALEVDGRAAVIEGSLFYEEAVSPLPWMLLTAGVAGAIGLAGRKRPLAAAAGALAVVSGAAVVVGRADFVATPVGGANPLHWALPVVALAAAVIGLLPWTRRFALIGTLASVASLSGWALFRFEVLTKPVLPTELSASLDRATVAVALGVAVATAFLAVTTGALRLPDLEDD